MQSLQKEEWWHQATDADKTLQIMPIGGFLGKI